MTCMRTCVRALGSRADLVSQHTTMMTNTKSYMCPVCGRALSSPGSLGRHLLIHSEDRLSNCAVCGARFTDTSNFNRCVPPLRLRLVSRRFGPFSLKTHQDCGVFPQRETERRPRHGQDGRLRRSRPVFPVQQPHHQSGFWFLPRVGPQPQFLSGPVPL